MFSSRRSTHYSFRPKKKPLPSRVSKLWPWFVVIFGLSFVRIVNKPIIVEYSSRVLRPFWPGASQREWIENAVFFEGSSRLPILEADNRRLRYLLGLKESKPSLESAPVISRYSSRWWQELELGKGKRQNFRPGDSVLGPGGLIGHIISVTPNSSRVRLLTHSKSQVGVWVSRTNSHGLLIGRGMDQPLLRFLEKDPQIKVGDVVSTSPGSSLMPPNLLVGVIQAINNKTMPVPEATIKLTAPIEAIDWVQVNPMHHECLD
uniref:Cell shape-determining protein MreC n=1 Tax=Paulinella chromatophora TaxID=39717 RepID=B1X4M6_PAUCH|nr:putative rod shape-determining protein [Paulinella chromatophora]ACB42895.1 putative rod shape-determining protein [Paulinella chromatophora]